MHGLRNHFVIVDARDEPYRPDADEIRTICDQQTGVGADQLVVVEPPDDIGADAFMRLYNVDGREVEACGNATRCVAWLLLEEYGRDSVSIETLAGILDCRRSGEKLVTCDMGELRTGWRDIPLSREADSRNLALAYGALRGGFAVSVGNPHVVFFVEDLDAIDVAALAPSVQRDPLFPEQVNVGVAQVTGARSIRLVVYERGAGLTMACGSGACAAVYAGKALGVLGDGPVAVSLPGGQMRISIEAGNRAIMTGPVAHSFTGTLPAG
jgi:diaminopimelate epimerase